MRYEEKSEKYRQLVENKFQIYNSLFMSLPYDKMSNFDMLLPFCMKKARQVMSKEEARKKLWRPFFAKHTELQTETPKTELHFKMIQYIERQVVLFDSIEDGAFPGFHSESDAGTLHQLHERAFALLKIQKSDRDAYEKLVMRSLFGNINASRNSA